MEISSTMDSADTRRGINYSSGQDIYGITSELTMEKAKNLLTYWVNKTKSLQPNLTLDEYHTLLINSNPKMVNMLKKNTSWSASFMIDTIHFQFGGERRIIDYPQITLPYVGQCLTIKGVQHEIIKYGLLTFDTQIVSNNKK